MPQSPKLLHKLLAQSPALVHLHTPLTQLPAAQGFVPLQARPTHDPDLTPEQLSILPHDESPRQEAGVPLHEPL